MMKESRPQYLKMGEIKKCDGVCKLNHPIENCVVIEGSKHNFITNMFESFTGAKKVWCVWCVVEKMVQDRMD
ncbi:hypothetical protein PRIPAC_81008 [Pristionchus pacificus]|uniref:Uncharacterized protein n=1 Tax=Pristionchus pacificus TaxID=54126 RepID=A0A454XM97_PRIPA|nr:hypothetical protein PRIPAC_81008 [Pristionchus pacificus]|eukprot:PDM75661.1 hypothetical protein PRIPAC_42838 [Pristionchus pacificus]